MLPLPVAADLAGSDLARPDLAWAIALGIGLLIGAERERRKGQGRRRAVAGLRTFAITGLLGAAAEQAGGTALVGVVTAGLLGLLAVSYYTHRSDDPGLTTEISLVVTLVLGALTVRAPATAAAVAVVVTILLAARTPLHRFVRNVLTAAELKSALVFAAATLVIWPNLPDRYLGPYEAINPRAVWTLVVLVLAIGACGHVAVRTLGARAGLPLAGLASGFVSSSATIAAMAARSRADSTVQTAAAAGAVLSTIATIVQTALVLAVVDPSTLAALAAPLACAGLAAVAYGAAISWPATGFPVWVPAPAVGTAPPPTRPMATTDGAPDAEPAPRPSGDDEAVSGDAFSVPAALLLAATITAVLVLAAWIAATFGTGGLLASAAVAGLADAHAAAVAVAAQVAGGKLTAEAAVVPVLVGLSTNTVTKIVVATTGGGLAFAQRIVPGLVLVIAAAWAGTALT